MSDPNRSATGDHAHKDDQNTQGTPDGTVEADTASGGAPEPADTGDDDVTTGDDGTPVENPSGG